MSCVAEEQKKCTATWQWQKVSESTVAISSPFSHMDVGQNGKPRGPQMLV